MKRKIITISVIVLVALVILALIFVAVNAYNNRIRAGWIIQKTYSQAHTSRFMIYIRVNKIMIPKWHTIYHNDRWTLTIEDGDNRADWDVRESIYDSYNVGDWFNVEEVISDY